MLKIQAVSVEKLLVHEVMFGWEHEPALEGLVISDLVSTVSYLREYSAWENMSGA